jgi:urea transporter
LFFEEQLIFGVILFVIVLTDFNVFTCTSLSLLSAILASKLFKFDKEQMKDGFYGVNPFLCGGCVSVFYPNNVAVAIIAGVLCTLIMKLLSLLFSKLKMPILSSPFIITFSLIMVFYKPSLASGSVIIVENYTETGIIDFFKEIFFCFSSMCFLTKWWQGILILILFSWFSYRMAILSFLGVASVLLLFRVIDYGQHFTSFYFFGFNFILTAIASQIFFPEVKKKILLSFFLTLLCGVIVIPVFHYVSVPLGIGVFSIPFFIVIFGGILLKRLVYDRR